MGNILQIFKDNKGRFSSKRTVAGAIVAIATTDAVNRGEIMVLHVIMCAIAGAIVLFAPALDAKSKDEYPKEGDLS